MTEDTDPRLEREHELVAETLFATMEGDLDLAEALHEELEDLQMDTLPPEGKFRIQMGKPRSVPEHEVECPDCGRMLRGGGGVAFFEQGERGLTHEKLTLAHHHILGKNACMASRWRWHRFKRDKLGLGWIERKLSSFGHRHQWFRPMSHKARDLLFRSLTK